MTEKLKLRGIILWTSPVREYDKRVVILTGERGKITAFCRGARRPKSNMLAVTEPFVFGDFFLVPGREAYTLVGAEVQNYFMELRQDLTATGYGMYFLEYVSWFAKENLDGTNLLKLLYQTLRELCRKRIDAVLIRRIFELKVLVYEGEYPRCFSCCKCGGQEKLAAFSFGKNGVICENCLDDREGWQRVHPSTVYTLQYIISADLKKLYTFTVSDVVLKDLETIMDRYICEHVGHRFHSLEFLELL